MQYTIHKTSSRRLLLSTIIISAFFCFSPLISYAQSYVPVNDADLIDAFSDYVDSFDEYAEQMNDALTDAEDSLRDIIAGKNPGGVATEGCETGPPVNTTLVPYEDPAGPWRMAISSTTKYLEDLEEAGSGSQGARGLTVPPDDFSDVEINVSGSLRCILQDLVGYQKMSNFLQIQSLIKQYVSDAQQKALAGQLLSKISATNLNWAQQGNIVNNFGVMVTESVYVQNSSQTTYNENGRIVNNMVNRAATQDDNDPDGIGSLGLNKPLYVAEQIASTMKDETQGPTDSLAAATRMTLTSDEIDVCMDDANADECPLGGAYFALGDMFQNFQNTPLGATTLVQAATAESITQNDERNKLRQTGSGFTATKKCSGLKSDPGCAPELMVDVTPAGQNAQAVTDAAADGNKQLATSDIPDSLGDGEVGSESTDINTDEGGLSGYDTTKLQNVTTGVNLLISEMYSTIENAYFDLNDNQKKWSEAALLMIYDEMNFDDSKPATQFPGDEEDLGDWFDEDEEEPVP